MACGDGAWHWPSALCALAGAVLIQTGANYANDYLDFLRGADTPNRLGPRRATQAGLVSPAGMRHATILVFALACIPGAYIVYRGGWPFVVIGASSILFAVLYTAGPYPLGYIGLADVFVLVFFGPVALCGTYYLQTGRVTHEAWAAGLATGLLSTALLTVNNLRDIDEDRAAGKRTLAVRFGRGFARAEYAVCLIGAALVIPLYLFVRTGKHLLPLVPLVVLGIGMPAVHTVLTTTDGATLNRVLGTTGKLLLMFGVFFSLSWLA